MGKHLIHIGYPKAGSTFLQEWFRQHPHLLYAPGGLGSFYNVYEISRQASKNDNLDLMCFVTSDESLSTPKLSSGFIPIENGIGDYTKLKTVKMAQKKVCETLKCLYPNGRILFVTRGFKGISMSGYSQYIREGGGLSFQKFIDVNRASMMAGHHETSKVEEVDYTFVANIYEEAFGKENMIILPFELLRDDQNTFLTVIEERLGLPHFEAKIGRINESLSPEELYWYPRMSSVVSRVTQRFGQKAYAKAYRWYVSKTLENKFHWVIKILSRLKPDSKVVEADFPFELLDFFRENNVDRFAAKFHDDPMYAPYLSEYLLD